MVRELVTDEGRNIGSDAPAIAPARLAHVVIRTARMQESSRWYQIVLNARVAVETPRSVGLTFDHEHHRLALVAVPEQATSATDEMMMGNLAMSQSPGLEHVAYGYAKLGDLLNTYLRLKAAGITPFRCINHGGTTSFYYKDPDGHQAELFIDNMTNDQADDFMRAALKVGHGLPIDPETLVEQFREGRPVVDIVMEGFR